MRIGLYLCGVAAVVSMLVWIDTSASDVANQVSLLAVVVGSAALGFARPSSVWLTALVVGGCLAVAHGVYIAAGIRLAYPMSPPGWAGVASLLILIVPALIAACAGAGAAKLMQRHRAT